MESHYASIINIKKILNGFKSDGYNHKDYLESQIENLESLIVMYRAQSKNKELPPRIRARSRDLEQNTMGLLNGIKFSLSFIERQNRENIDD